MLTDCEIMRRVQNGERELFGELLRRRIGVIAGELCRRGIVKLPRHFDRRRFQILAGETLGCELAPATCDLFGSRQRLGQRIRSAL